MLLVPVPSRTKEPGGTRIVITLISTGYILKALFCQLPMELHG